MESQDLTKPTVQVPASPAAPVGQATAAETKDVQTLPEESAGGRIGETAGYTLSPGDTVNRYVVLDRLGVGGMGEVVLAYDPELERRVALKLVKRVKHLGRSAQAALLREARALARINELSVVAVHDAGVHAERVFIVMEFVEGRTLRRWAQDTHPGWRRALAIYRFAAGGLAAVHEAGLVHRDIKPDNVMLGDDGRVRVMDFGLAQVPGSGPDELALAQAERVATQESGERSRGAPSVSSSIVGTPAYMAPELLRGAVATAQSDQFAFCVSLYEAVHGVRPFRGSSAAAIYQAQEAGLLARGAQVVTPRWLDLVLARGLALEPSDRFGDMSALLADLDRGLRQRGRRRLAGAATLVGTLALSVPAFSAWQKDVRTAACGAQSDSAAQVWTPEIASRVDVGLRGNELAYAADVADRVRPWIERDVRALRDSTHRACVESTVSRAWSPETTARAQWCLQTHAEKLEGLLTSFVTADDRTVRAAVASVATLASPAHCVDPRVLTLAPSPPPPEVQAALKELRADARAVRVQMRKGDYNSAHELALELVEHASVVDWEPASIDALRLLGTAASRLGDYDEAARAWTEAYFTSVRTEHWDQAARLASSLITLKGHEQSRIEVGQLWSLHAAAAAQRAGDPLGLLDAQRLVNLSTVYGRLGEWQKQLDTSKKALAIDRAARPPDHPSIAFDLFQIGGAELRLGLYPAARGHYLEAVQIRKAAFGPMHPKVAEALSNVAAVDFETGDRASAKTLFREAYAIYRASTPTHATARLVAANLAFMDAEDGEFESAAETFQGIVDEWPPIEAGHSDANLAKMYGHLGNVRVGLRDFKAAEKAFAMSMDLHDRVDAPSHTDRLFTMQNRADMAIAQGFHESAVEQFSEILRLRQQETPVNESYLAGDHTDLGRVLAQVGRGDEALKHCESAREIRERTVDADAPIHAGTLLCTATAHVAAGRSAEGLAVGERGLGVAERGSAEILVHAELEFLVASLGFAANRGVEAVRKRSDELSERALARFGKAGRGARVADVKAWREAHL